MICVPIEDSDLSGHSPSQTSVFYVRSMDSLGPRLILVFAGRTGHFVGFVVLRLRFSATSTRISNFRVQYDLCSSFEPRHDKTNKMIVRRTKTQIRLGIRPAWSEFSLCAQLASFLHADSDDWSDLADAQVDLSLRWAHTHFVGFVMLRLIFEIKLYMSTRNEITPLYWYRSRFYLVVIF